MCRFVAYLGRPITVDELLIKPVNSLVHQSYDAGDAPEALNGDGFGLGWYVRDVSVRPGLFRSITPAWNNNNLLYNAAVIQTNCVFAHVRAASEGSVSEANTHPFHHRRFLMMHNGGIPKFRRIRRLLLSLLNDDLFDWIQGQSDSEHVFALLMQNLYEMRRTAPAMTLENLQQGFQQTFDTVQELKREAGIGDEVSTFNMMATDGERIIGTRYSSDPERETRTLYYATGSRFECVDGLSRMAQDDNGVQAVLIASEKLNVNADEWQVVPQNHFLYVENDLSVHLRPMSV
jgi:glutamine amidotransferase